MNTVSYYAKPFHGSHTLQNRFIPWIFPQEPYLAKPLRSVNLSTGAIPCKTAPFRVRITKYQSGGRFSSMRFTIILLQYFFCKKRSCCSTYFAKSAAVTVPTVQKQLFQYPFYKNAKSAFYDEHFYDEKMQGIILGDYLWRILYHSGYERWRKRSISLPF